MPEKVLVTGATGQIGAPLVRALVARGYDVHALVRGAGAAIPGAKVVVGTLEDASALAEAVAGASLVFHLAGGLRGAGAMTADRLNRVGTEALIAALATRRPRAVVFASTCAVYGDRSGLWVPEDYPPSPQTRYGASKVAAEAALLRAHAERGLPVRIARVAAVYGPGFRFLMRDAMRAGRAWLPGEGRNHVPVIHVDDCVAALLRIAEAGPDGGIVHVGGRSAPTLAEFYAAVHARAGGAPLRFWSTWIPSAFQFGAARANERVQTRLGGRPRFTEDNLRLYTASVRLRTDRLEKELGFTWAYPDHEAGLDACGLGPDLPLPNVRAPSANVRKG